MAAFFRPANLLWAESAAQLAFNGKAEAVGATPTLTSNVPVDDVGFFGIDGL